MEVDQSVQQVYWGQYIHVYKSVETADNCQRKTFDRAWMLLLLPQMNDFLCSITFVSFRYNARRVPFPGLASGMRYLTDASGKGLGPALANS